MRGDGRCGFYCPACFIKRAEAAGSVPTGWELRPEEPSPDTPDKQMEDSPISRIAAPGPITTEDETG